MQDQAQEPNKLERTFIARPLPAIIAIGTLSFLALLDKMRNMAATATVPIYGATLRHDAVIAGTLLLVYAVSVLVCPRSKDGVFAKRSRQVTSAILRLLIVSGVAIYWVDVFAYRLFATRLYVTDLIMFRHDWRVGLGLVRALLNWSVWKLFPLIVVIAIGVLSLVWFVIRPQTMAKRQAVVVALGAVVLISVRFVPHDEFFINKPLYENFVERNWDFLVRKEYSPAFRKRILSAYSDPSRCEAGRSYRPNILLVVVESLSAYHSRYLSGINDFTPNLDRIAQRHTVFTNFYANGWTSQGGAIALLTEAYPLVPEHAELNEWGSARINQFYSPAALPKYLRGEGYRTFYFAAGSLQFLDQDQWLKRIGFDEVHGDKDPAFDKEPRGFMNSVTDTALYERALKEIATLPADQRFFMMLATYRSHRPLRGPDGLRISEERAFHDVDVQLEHLYERLQEIKFFDNGILVITGDHRAMEPFKAPEVARFGMSASARLPFVVVSENLGLPHVVDGNFQQHDFFPSIRYLVSGQYCYSSWEGTFLSTNPRPARCIIHAKGESRDLVYVRCGQQEGMMYLDGDDTRMTSGNIEDATYVVDKVNFERIQRGMQSSQPAGK